MNRAQIRARLVQLAELRKAAQKRVEDNLQVSPGSGRAQTSTEPTALSEARAEVSRIDTEVASLADLDDELRVAEGDAAGPSRRRLLMGAGRRRRLGGPAWGVPG